MTLALSLAAVHLICQISGAVPSALGRALQALGRASITIMFVHPAVFMWLRDDVKMTNNEVILFVVALGMPFALHQLLERTAATRRLFLGQGIRAKGAATAPPVGPAGS